MQEDKTIEAQATNEESPTQTKKRKKRLPIYSIVRIAIQIGFFVWIPTLYFSAFSSLMELILFLLRGTFDWGSLWPSILPLLAVVPITMLAGRYFCGWMCAFGSLTDWVYRVFSPLTNQNLRISKKADDVLKIVKICVFIVLLGIGWLAASLSLSAMSPWDAFGMLFTVGAAPALVFVIQSLMPGLVLLILILFASAFTERFFCRYLCPLGAIFALTSGAKISFISKPRDNCGKCRICTRNCAMGIPLYEMDQVKSGECIGCMKCVEVCPRKNVRVQVRKNAIHPIVITITMVCLISGFLSIATVLSERSNASNPSLPPPTQVTAMTSAVLETLASESIPTGTDGSSVTQETTAAPTTLNYYKDGIFRGVGTGYKGGTTKVDVTIINGQITNVTEVSNQDDWEFFDKAFPKISDAVISSQSAKVDTVSHATYSSEGIIEAVKDALSKAKN